MPCLGHQIHDFSKFEFLNIQKTVNGHLNGKIPWIVSWLIGSQEGLSISTLSVEQSTLKVTHMITTSSTGVSTITDTLFAFNLWEDPDFDIRNLPIWLIIDNSIKNHQFLINQLDFWNRRTLIMMKFYFLVKFSVEMTHLSVKFSYIWINIENFPSKIELIRSVFFVNFFTSGEQAFSVKKHIELLNSTWFVFCRGNFRVSISLLRREVWLNIDQHICTPI